MSAWFEDCCACWENRGICSGLDCTMLTGNDACLLPGDFWTRGIALGRIVGLVDGSS